MRTWTRVASVGGLFATAVALTAALAAPSGATITSGSRPATVRVDRVQAAPTTRVARLHGMIRAQERSTVAFTSPGRLVQRAVEVGDHVHAGDVLARLDPAPLRHQVVQAQAHLADVQARLDQVSADRARLQQLDRDQAVAPVERERLESQERSLQAGLSQARVGLDEALRQQREGVLRAPYDAEVVAAMVQAGETVAAGTPVLALAGLGHEVVVEAPEAVWARLQGPVDVQVDLPGIGCEDVPATVHRVGQGAVGAAALFPVHVRLAQGGSCPLAAGLSADVDLILPVAPALAVPVRAVIDPTGAGASVLRVRGDRVDRVAVQPLRLHGDEVAVSGALQSGDEVVVAGLVGLVDGQQVQVLR